MSYVKKSIATLFVGAVLTAGAVAPATAAPNTNNQSGGAAGLVAAVVQANVQEVRVVTVEGPVNVALTNLLNNNRILTDFLNNNTVTDVVNVTIEDNVLIIGVLSVI